MLGSLRDQAQPVLERRLQATRKRTYWCVVLWLSFWLVPAGIMLRLVAWYGGEPLPFYLATALVYAMLLSWHLWRVPSLPQLAQQADTQLESDDVLSSAWAAQHQARHTRLTPLLMAKAQQVAQKVQPHLLAPLPWTKAVWPLALSAGLVLGTVLWPPERMQYLGSAFSKAPSEASQDGAKLTLTAEDIPALKEALTTSLAEVPEASQPYAQALQQSLAELTQRLEQGDLTPSEAGQALQGLLEHMASALNPDRGAADVARAQQTLSEEMQRALSAARADLSTSNTPSSEDLLREALQEAALAEQRGSEEELRPEMTEGDTPSSNVPEIPEEHLRLLQLSAGGLEDAPERTANPNQIAEDGQASQFTSFERDIGRTANNDINATTPFDNPWAEFARGARQSKAGESAFAGQGTQALDGSSKAAYERAFQQLMLPTAELTGEVRIRQMLDPTPSSQNPLTSSPSSTSWHHQADKASLPELLDVRYEAVVQRYFTPESAQ